MAISNLERYGTIYSGMRTCRIPDAVRAFYKNRFGAIKYDHHDEMFIDSDPAHIEASLDLKSPNTTKITGGSFYVFAYCGDWRSGRRFVEQWIPFHVFNAINPSVLTDISMSSDHAVVKVSNEEINLVIYIILYRNYALMLGGNRSAPELSVLAKGFNASTENR